MQHRDLKPNNVVFDEYGDARVIDLGLAIVVKAKAAVSSAGGANKVGAEAYRSPEKADGHTYDGKDDVWALGCMLGGAVTGTLAEDRCSGRALTRAAAKALVDEAAASEKFGGLVAEMLAKSPKGRPTAQDVELLLLRGELRLTTSGCATIVEEEGDNEAEQIDLCKLALVGTLKVHSYCVAARGVHCTFVMICLRCRSISLPYLGTAGASCLVCTARSRCGTSRPANASRRSHVTRLTCVVRRPLYFCDDLPSS